MPELRNAQPAGLRSPQREIIIAEVAALLVMATSPLTLPADAGANATLSVVD